MDKICSIRYVDAYYSYEKSIGETKLSFFEAHGYVEKNENNIVVSFIKERGLPLSNTISDKKNIVKGLVIPDKALVSVVSNYHTNMLSNINQGSAVEVTWRDIVYIANLPRYDCSIMYTEGIIFKIKKDHIVLKNPETIRTYPAPIKNHPGGGHPTYLVVPISFITDIKLINK